MLAGAALAQGSPALLGLSGRQARAGARRQAGQHGPQEPAWRQEALHRGGRERPLQRAGLVSPRPIPRCPTIVAHGRKPEVFACGYCHLPNGQGRPENASLAGQPADYIVQQVEDMREGTRKSSTDKMGSINAMMGVAKASNDAEVQHRRELFLQAEIQQMDPGGGNRHGPQDRDRPATT